MKGSIRQRSPGSWELTIDAGRDPLGKRQRKYVTVPGTKAQTQRKLRELLSRYGQGHPHLDREDSPARLAQPRAAHPRRQVARRQVRSPESDSPKPAPLPRLRHASERTEPVVVSKRLGHANVSITSDIYAHSLPGWQKQAADAFAEAMNADNADSRRQSP